MRLEPPAKAGMGPGSPKPAGKEDRQEGGTAQEGTTGVAVARGKRGGRPWTLSREAG